MLEDSGFAADGALDGGTEATDGGAVTDQLLEGETTTCWTCGSTVERDHIEATLDQLRELRSEKLSERNDVTVEMDELKAERKQRREARQEREQAERRLEQVEDDLERSRERIESLESEREDLTQQIEEYQADLDERDELEEQREDFQEELIDLRTHVERIEADAVEQFNIHIESILDILAYDNIERIWIERRESEVREGRRKVQQSTFDLRVIRSSEGSAYRDSVEHLSESEREVTGLVFALAGYLVHDVNEELPFILLDSLEAIDADRIAALVEYFEDYVDYLAVALLPEDAQALEGQQYSMIESI